MSKAISYISDIRWFSAKHTKGKYKSVWDALRAHISYIARKSRKEEHVITHNLSPGRWEEICEKALARNCRARVACKLTFALPNTLTPVEGLKLVQDFLTREQIFKSRVWDPVKKKTIPKPVLLDADDVGIAVHDTNGVSGDRNLHAHILISARPAAGGSLRADRADLSKMHKKWREFLTKRGFEVVCPDDEVKQHHVGPSRLRARNKRVKEEAMRELQMLNESYQALRRAQQEEERYLEEIEEIQKKQKMQREYEERVRNLNAVAVRLASRIKTDLLGIVMLVILLGILLKKQALSRECKRFQQQVNDRIQELNRNFKQAAAQGNLKDARSCVKELVSLKNRVSRERRDLETELAKAIPLDRVAAALGIEVKNLKIKQDSNGRWLWFDPAAKRGGSNVDLVMQHQNLDFREAVKWILSNNNDYLEKLKEEAMKPIKLEQLTDLQLRELKETYGLGHASWAWSKAFFKRHEDGRIEPVWLKPKERHITLHGGTEAEGVPARALVVCDHPLHCAFLAATLPFPPYGTLGLSLNGVPLEAGGELEQVLSVLIKKGMVNKDTKIVLAVGDEGASADLSNILNNFGLEPWEDFSGWLDGVTHLDELRARLLTRAEQIQQAAQQAAAQQAQQYVNQDGQVVEEDEQHWDFMPRPGGRR